MTKSLKALAALASGMALLASGTAEAQTWDAMRDITPRGYVAVRASEPLEIDGQLDDPAWTQAPWSAPFVDIEGDRRPRPRFETRLKMLWDDDFLYVGAWLEEPHVWGAITERNAVIFYDNDFEIFLDPDGDNHTYYEFEVNALGTIWELTLEKPYKDGGPAISPTNLPGLRSAVWTDGTLNDPQDRDRGWSVEVAIPLSELERYNGGARPAAGDQWRINFSRVQWRHRILGGSYEKVPEVRENNWVWSPQGLIDMHRPERWGFVQFSDAAPGVDRFRPDPTLPARDLLMEVYHAQKGFRAEHERWAASLEELALPPALLLRGPARITALEPTPEGFRATATLARPGEAPRTFHTDQHSRIWEAERGS